MKPDIVSQLDIFFARFPEATREKGAIIIHASEQPPGVIYLTSGIVREYAVTAKGEEATVNMFKAFSYFPMSWAMNKTPNRYYFEAVTPITYRVAPPEEVLSLLQTKPQLLYDLLQRVYRGVDGLLTRLEYIMSGSAEMKVVYTILNAAYRFGEPSPDGVRIPLKITHKDLATLSGTSRETFSREIRKLEKAGKIRIQGGCIVINDLAELEKNLVYG